MIATIIIAVLTCIILILGILFFPKIKLGKISIDSYWVISLIGAITVLIINGEYFGEIMKGLIEGTFTPSTASINPVKILILFISMTVLSVFLDELGFFSYLANESLKRAKTSQTKLFLYLYLTVSVLTVFTSNDIIILSFTPFICYFSKNAKINPLPYLACEFVGANTWSMALIIGNPTNIYLATASGIRFVEYLSVMIVPTLVGGTVAFIIMFLIFKKSLSKPLEPTLTQEKIKDKPLFIIGIIHLALCTVLLAVSSYIGLEMWIVSLTAVVSLSICTLIESLVKNKPPKELLRSLKRAPWQLIPFLISMFVIIKVLEKLGVCNSIYGFFGESYSHFTYGFTSFFACNLINNIPMSVLYSSIINNGGSLAQVYATVVGSNLGALFTPIGALAGIMWSNILSSKGIKFGYKDFVKMGVFIGLPVLAVTLLTLTLFV